MELPQGISTSSHLLTSGTIMDLCGVTVKVIKRCQSSVTSFLSGPPMSVSRVIAWELYTIFTCKFFGSFRLYIRSASYQIRIYICVHSIGWAFKHLVNCRSSVRSIILYHMLFIVCMLCVMEIFGSSHTEYRILRHFSLGGTMWTVLRQSLFLWRIFSKQLLSCFLSIEVMSLSRSRGYACSSSSERWG